MKNLDELSDEEFLKEVNSGGGVETPAEPEVPSEDAPTGEQAAEAADPAETEQATTDDPNAEAAAGDDSVVGSGEAEVGDAAEGKDQAKPEAKDGAGSETAEVPAEGAEGKTVEGQAEEQTPDYAAFYAQVMKPFRANGKEFTLQSPEEAIRLMQLGAGAGKRMQELQPHLRTIRTLEKNNLLDQGKLNFLIDLNNKNPDAIKKLVKDSGINPLDLDIQDNVDYVPRNHAATDTEVSFHSALNELNSQPGGAETIRTINATWDQPSKSMLWESPQIMQVIHEQVTSGIYPVIAAEVERQRTLGIIPYSMPFVQAYKVAGDYLVTQRPPNPAPAAQENTPKAQPAVVGVRVQAPKPQVSNGDRVKSVAHTPPRRPVKPIDETFTATDEDFMKQFKGRTF